MLTFRDWCDCDPCAVAQSSIPTSNMELWEVVEWLTGHPHQSHLHCLHWLHVDLSGLVRLRPLRRHAVVQLNELRGATGGSGGGDGSSSSIPSSLPPLAPC